MHLFIYAIVWKKEKLHYNSYTNFISEVVNIDFWQIWHFDVKGTGWVVLELSIIFMQIVRRFDMWVTPYIAILTLAKLKYFMSKDLGTKTLWSCTAANNTGHIQSIKQEILSAKVKPGRPIQNFD